MLDTPAISVVIPTYNAAKFLREALDSLLAQTFTNWEAVCVNDGSTDNSLEILQEYAARDSRFRILDGPNGGYGKAMNRGMDAAAGKYLAILEPDDILPVRAYEFLWSNARENSLDVSRGAVSRFYDGERGGRVHAYWADAVELDRVFRPGEDGNFLVSVPNTWSALYRLDFLRCYSIRHHESPGASYQDAGFFFLTAAYAERCMVSHEVVYLYRTDNDASSVRKRIRDLATMSREYAYVREHLGTKAADSPVLRLALHRRFIEGNLWLYERLAEEQRWEFLEGLRQELPAFAGASIPLMPGALRRKAVALAQGPAVFMAFLLAEEGMRVEIAALRDSLSRRSGIFVKSGPGWVEYGILGLPLYRSVETAENTERRLLGVPLLVRRRHPASQEVAPGQLVPVGWQEVYRLAGVPVARRVYRNRCSRLTVLGVPLGGRGCA